MGPGPDFATRTECAEAGPGQNFNSNHISDFVSAPATGAGRVTHATFANAYLFPNPEQQTWDEHLNGLSTSATPPTPNETSGTINRLVRELTTSCYFDALTQYGIQPPEFVGRVPTVPRCVQSALADSYKGVIQWDTLRSFAACEKDRGGLQFDQLNIYISPDLASGNITAPPFHAPDMCPTGSAASYHAWGFTVPDFAVLPTAMSCASNVSTLMANTAHEMVEIVTDPKGSGWIAENENRATSFPAEFDEGEVSDICDQGGVAKDAAGGVLFFSSLTSSLGPLELPTYWSNADNACEPTSLPTVILAKAAGQPATRLTGQRHHLEMPFAPTSAVNPDSMITQLSIRITTGEDNLNAGSSSGDNADVDIILKNGHTLPFRNINSQSSWGSNTLHASILPLPPNSLRIGDIKRVVLSTGFGGGLGGDNWDIVKAVLLASGTTPSSPITISDTRQAPEVRIDQSWNVPLVVDGSDHTPISSLDIMVVTGSTEVHGRQRPVFSVHLKSGMSVQSRDPLILGTAVSPGRLLRRQTVRIPSIQMPPGTEAGDINGLTVNVLPPAAVGFGGEPLTIARLIAIAH